MSLCQVRKSVSCLATLFCVLGLAALVAGAAAPAALAADIDPPTLLSSEPVDGAALAAPPTAIVLHYSEELSASPLPTATLIGGGLVASVAVAGADVTVTPLGFFLPHSGVSLAVSGVTDLAGNPAAPATVAFSVDRVPTMIEPWVSRTIIVAGKMALLSCQVQQPDASAGDFHSPIAGMLVVIERRYAGEAGFTAIAPSVTDAGGVFTRTLTPKANATYRVTTPETVDLLATTAEIAVSVRPRLRFETPKAIFKGQKIVFRGSVAPEHPGGTVTIQRKIDGVWKDFRAVTLNSKSHFTTRWEPASLKTYRFRLSMAADEQHLSRVTPGRATVVSPPNPHHISPSYKHFIVVDLSECHLYYYESGRLVKRFDCVVGKPSTPTPIGQWPIYQKVVGMWGPYGPFTMWYHAPYHFGIHGTDEPQLLTHFPRYYSHGCTRLANANISWLFPRVPVGTPVRNIR